MTVLDDATGVRFWLRESSGDWRIWALEKTGLPAAPDDFVDLEKLSESLGPMGDIVRKSIAASIPPERLTEPASPEQQAEIETTVRTMLVASDDLEAKTYVSMYTPEARPMAETIQHTYPPPGTTYDYGPAKVSGDEAQMEVTWRATGQPERTFLFSLRRISEGWRVVGNGVLPAEYVNYELMSGIMDETERLMSSRLGGFGQMPFGAPPAATPPPLAQGPVDPGSLDGKVYTNAQLGLTVTVPDGWRPIFGSELEGLINVGISQSYGSGSQEAIVGRERLASGRIRKLLAVARDAGANAPIQEHLFIEGQNLPPVGRAMSASEILKVMRDAVENSGAGAKIDPTPEEKTIDGREFAVLRVTFDLQGMTLTQERHFAVVNDRLLAIDLSFMTQEQRGDLEAVLQGIKIAPPLP
jgi:hypothetical protein